MVIVITACQLNILQINQQVMKKNRKVGAATDTNFFTSEFKLRPLQPNKQTHHRKLNTTFNSFKLQLIQQQTKRKTRQSKEKKPHIEQLQFLHPKEDNFKIPQSLTKRSLSKAKDESILRIQKKNHQLNQHYQEVPVAKGQVDKQRHILNMTQALKSKRFNPKDALKQKLEKAALQKFNQTVLKQNQQNQNVVSQKNAESLYLLLKTARMNQLKQKNMHFKSSPSENQDENHHHKTQLSQAEQFQPSLKQKLRKQSQKIVQKIHDTSKNPDSKQGLFRTFQQPENKRAYQFIPKPITKKPSVEQIKKDLIQPKKVVCDDSQREKFTSNQMQSQSQNLSDSFDLKQQSSIAPKVSKVQQSLPSKEEKKNTIKQTQPMVRKDSQTSNQINQKIQNKLQLLPIESKNSIQRKAQVKKQDKRYQESDLQSIPNAETFEKKYTKTSIDNSLPKKGLAPKEPQLLKFQNKVVESVVSPKSVQGQKNFGNKQHPKPNTLPKLAPNLQSKVDVSKVTYTSYGEEDDEIQQIDLKGKKGSSKEVKQKPPIETSKKIQQNKNQKSKHQQIKNQKIILAQNDKSKNKAPQIKNKPIQNKNEPIKNNIPIQAPKQQENNEQQEDEYDLYDQLAYYIQRIEDIGHYRMSSKNIYKDISVSVQLIKFHKICAYYMAHQFLFLSKKACNHFKSEALDSDFYDITSQDLKTMKQEGVLDEQIANLQSHIQESKVLLKKCYDECKMYLATEDQILILDGKTNFHIKCCAYLIKQFKKVYELLDKNKGNQVIIKRCVYLIEIYCSLKQLNGQFIKQYQEFEQIQNQLGHIEKYKVLLTS